MVRDSPPVTRAYESQILHWMQHGLNHQSSDEGKCAVRAEVTESPHLNHRGPGDATNLVRVDALGAHVTPDSPTSPAGTNRTGCSAKNAKTSS